MQVDGLAIELRPRPMAEAADLGVLLVQANARSIWGTFAPVFLVVVLVAAASAEIAPWLPFLIVFWLKPWLDRTLLFVVSRAVFGQSTHLADLWQHRSTVLWGQWLSTLLWWRLSPWRGYTQPVYQLEGQRGKARRQRRAQMLRGKRGAAMMLQFAFANTEMVLTLGVLAVAMWFAPDDSKGNLMDWLFKSESPLAAAITDGTYAAVVLLLEPFYVAAGFLMYLNRRVELEAWDIEQEFRRAFSH